MKLFCFDCKSQIPVCQLAVGRLGENNGKIRSILNIHLDFVCLHLRPCQVQLEILLEAAFHSVGNLKKLDRGAEARGLN